LCQSLALIGLVVEAIVSNYIRIQAYAVLEFLVYIYMTKSSAILKQYSTLQPSAL